MKINQIILTTILIASASISMAGELMRFAEDEEVNFSSNDSSDNYFFGNNLGSYYLNTHYTKNQLNAIVPFGRYRLYDKISQKYYNLSLRYPDRSPYKNFQIIGFGHGDQYLSKKRAPEMMQKYPVLPVYAYDYFVSFKNSSGNFRHIWISKLKKNKKGERITTFVITSEPKPPIYKGKTYVDWNDWLKQNFYYDPVLFNYSKNLPKTSPYRYWATQIDRESIVHIWETTEELIYKRDSMPPLIK